MNDNLYDKIKSYRRVKSVLKKKGYNFFEGELNINLIGVRSKEIKAGQFDDFLCLAYEEGGQKILKRIPATTDPGVYYLEHPMNVKGTAILVPGQYSGVFEIGTYKGQPAFKQVGPFKVYRDNNKDEILDMIPGSIMSGYQGIHAHGKRGYLATSIGRWSAACQVPEFDEDLMEFIETGKRGARYYGKRVSYTLLEEHDFD